MGYLLGKCFFPMEVQTDNHFFQLDTNRKHHISLLSYCGSKAKLHKAKLHKKSERSLLSFKLLVLYNQEI